MERIAIAGLSLKEVDLSLLGALGRRAAADDMFARELADELGASELVLLATCNRIEVVFAREEGALPGARDLRTLATQLGAAPPDDVAARMHLHSGRAALVYLSRVACSLESLVVGEDQILAQVREAFGRASAAGLVGSLLAPLFRHALQTGKLARTRTDLARHPVSIVSLAVAELARRTPLGGRRALVVGAGKMGRLFVRALADAGATTALVASRSLASARALAAEAGAAACSLEDLADAGRPAPEVDLVVSATAAPDVVLGPAALARLAAARTPEDPLYAVDVALPRDLDPGGDARIELVDIETLRDLAAANQERRRDAARAAEALVEERAAAFFGRRTDPLVAAAVADLCAQCEEQVERELRELSSGPLRGLAAPDRQALERWARATLGRWNHAATARMKRLAREIEAQEQIESAAEGAGEGA